MAIQTPPQSVIDAHIAAKKQKAVDEAIAANPAFGKAIEVLEDIQGMNRGDMVAMMKTKA